MLLIRLASHLRFEKDGKHSVIRKTLLYNDTQSRFVFIVEAQYIFQGKDW